MVPSPWNDFTLCLPGQFLHVLHKHGPAEESRAIVSAKGTHKQKTGHECHGFQPLYSRDQGEAWKVNNITALRTFLHTVGRSNKIMTSNFYTALMIITLQVSSH